MKREEREKRRRKEVMEGEGDGKEGGGRGEREREEKGNISALVPEDFLIYSPYKLFPPTLKIHEITF